MEERGVLIMDKNLDVQESLFARSSREEVSVGLRWDGLLNTSPSTISLIKRRPHRVCDKTDMRGKPPGGRVELSPFLTHQSGEEG